MPLARHALYSQDVEIYVAPTYDGEKDWIPTLQEIASEGHCWVVGCGQVLRTRDIPDIFPGKSRRYPNPKAWVNPGDSVLIAPGGKIVAGPMHNRRGILIAEIDLNRMGVKRSGHKNHHHYHHTDHTYQRHQKPSE